MKKYILTTVFVASLCLAGTASAQIGGNFTNAGPGHVESDFVSESRPDLTSLMARIQALLEQVKQLREQVGGVSAGSLPHNSNPAFGTTPSGNTPGRCAALQNLGNFRRGMAGEGVRAIQQQLVAEGDLAAGNATGYFGTQTEQALRQWQVRNGVITSDTATSSGAGIFGPRTRSMMYQRCSGSTIDPINTTGTFRVSPSRGAAPLTVELAGLPGGALMRINSCGSAEGISNTIGILGGALTVDWGDGTIVTDTPKSTDCTNKLKKHTYTKPGAYTVKVTMASSCPGSPFMSAPCDAAWSGTAQVVVTDKEDTEDDNDTNEDADGTKVSNSTPAALKARTALAAKIDAFTSTITIKEVYKRDWSNSCLGLGGAAESCLTVITPGYRVTMEKATTTYYARTNNTGSVVRFEE